MEVDPAYEFDAPQFFDFRRTSLGNSEASKWFEQDHPSPLRENKNVANSGAPPSTAGKPGVAAQQQQPTTAKKANIVTSWGHTPATAKPGTAAKAEGAGRPTTARKAKVQQQENAAPVTTAKKTAKKEAAAQDGDAAGPSKAPAEPTTARAAGKRPPASASKPADAGTQKRAREQSAKLQRKGTETAKAQRVSEEGRNPRYEQPVTRSVTKAAAAAAAAQKAGPGPSVKSSLTSKSLKAAVAKARAGAAGKAAATPATTTKQQPRARPEKAAAPAPKAEKKVQEAAGSKRAATKQAAGAKGVVVGSRVLRASADQLKKVLQPKKVLPARSTRPLTLPDEPELHTAKRARHDDEQAPSKTPFKSLAAKVREFQTKTPGRFKAKAPPADPPKPLQATNPKTPLLMTVARTRPSRFKTREEEEAELMAAMPQFHARPLNHDVLAGAGTGAAPATQLKKPPTEPQPFSFITDMRCERRRRQQEETEDEDAAEFKALPLNKAILEAPSGLPKKPRMSLTVPKSPMLLTRTRIHEPKPEEPKVEFKARPVPDFLAAPQEFMSSRELPAPTEPQPFNLRTERRGRVHQERLQAKLSEEEAAAREARNIKAQLLPHTVDVPVVPPRPEPKPLTRPEPFSLRSEVRHTETLAKLTKQQQEEEELKRQQAEFKARPMWQGVPFKPKEAEANLTVPEPVQLATEARAQERQVFDALVQEKNALIEAEKAAAKEAMRLAEEAAVKEYRRSLRFKANPVPSFAAPMQPMPSDKPLTNPKTPKLGKKRKAEAAPAPSEK